jgi:urease accessory protein
VERGAAPPRRRRSAAEQEVTTVLVDEILGYDEDPRFAGRVRERLELQSEDARRRRLRRATAGGTDVAIDLPRGSFLRHRAVLHDDGRRVIVVERSPEPALVIRLDERLPADALVEQAARVGHWAGNQHLLVEAEGHELRVRIAATPELALRSAEALELEGARLAVADVRFALDRPPPEAHGHG